MAEKVCTRLSKPPQATAAAARRRWPTRHSHRTWPPGGRASSCGVPQALVEQLGAAWEGAAGEGQGQHRGGG